MIANASAAEQPRPPAPRLYAIAAVPLREPTAWRSQIGSRHLPPERWRVNHLPDRLRRSRHCRLHTAITGTLGENRVGIDPGEGPPLRHREISTQTLLQRAEVRPGLIVEGAEELAPA